MPVQLCVYAQGEPADEDLTLLVPGLTILTALPLMLAFYFSKVRSARSHGRVAAAHSIRALFIPREVMQAFITGAAYVREPYSARKHVLF